MKISNQLLEPLVEKMDLECRQLAAECSGVYTDAALEMKNFVQHKLRQLDQARLTLHYLHTETQGAREEFDLRNILRRHKLELRFAQRRWKRQEVSRDRTRRIKEKRENASTYAA